MKQINQFIQEKLKINKDNKTKDDFVETILSFIYTEPDDADKKEIEAISDWIKYEKVKNLKVITTEDVFKQYYMLDTESQIDNIKRNIETDDFKLILADDETYHSVESDDGINNYIVYQSKYNNEGSCTIYRNDKIHLLIYHFNNIGCFFFIPNSNDINK